MPGGHSPHGGTPSTHTRAFPVAIEALVLCLLVAVSYFPATMAGFVLDDNALTDARPVRTWDGIWHIWFQPGSLKQSEGHYWPVLYSTFWLEHKLWGFAPAGYHTVNLLLHSGVTLLLWRLLRRLAKMQYQLPREGQYVHLQHYRPPHLIHLVSVQHNHMVCTVTVLVYNVFSGSTIITSCLACILRS